MTVKIQDVLKADLVLVGVELLKSSPEVDRFRQSLGADFRVGTGLATNESSGETHPMRSFALQRDRITLNSLQDRSMVVKEYPSLASPQTEWDRMAEVTTYAIESTDESNRKPRAFGYNCEWIFEITDDQTAASFLGSRLLGRDIPARETWGLIGGAGTLMFSDGNRRWTLQAQPRPNGDPESKRIFLGLNLHIDEPRTPTLDEIRSSLAETWDAAEDFMARLRNIG